jgi:group I intron endonuclease
VSKAMAPGIYRIYRVDDPAKCYVGQSVNVYMRWNKHKNFLRHGTHHNEMLARDWAKYGPSAFAYEILEEVEPQPKLRGKLEVLEKHWFAVLRHPTKRNRPYYNLTSNRGGNERGELSDDARRRIGNAARGRKHSPEVRERISEATKAAFQRPEVRQRCLDAAKTKRQRTQPCSPEHKRKLSEAAHQRVYTEQEIANHSAARKRAWADPARRAVRLLKGAITRAVLRSGREHPKNSAASSGGITPKLTLEGQTA